MRQGEARELRWIEWIRRLEAEGPTEAFPLGIGDDAAIWRPPPGRSVVLTVDAQVEGVHFRREWLSPGEIGARAVTASVSDLAAMAARPVAILVSLCVEVDIAEEELRALHLGIRRAARAYGARIVGGNLSAGPLSLTITAVGEGKEGQLLRRSGAREGDEVWVTGSPGLARLGLLALQGKAASRSGIAERSRGPIVAALRAFRRPRARIREALHFRERWGPTAMIDLSDGLARDLRHVLSESSRGKGRALGATVEEARLEGLGKLPRIAALLGEDAAGTALEGGEDYEILFTAPPRRNRETQVRAFRKAFGLGLTRIGRIDQGAGIRLVSPDGSTTRVEARGWEHF
ncbi:MAG TPA: thiamine-phosphate kinase [Planctomycetota bacterium]|nr:thiamine-phosphate kinase [Planctomycetota bacterium]